MGVKNVQAQQECIVGLSAVLPGLFILILSLPQAMPLQKQGNRVAAHKLGAVCRQMKHTPALHKYEKGMPWSSPIHRSEN